MKKLIKAILIMVVLGAAGNKSFAQGWVMIVTADAHVYGCDWGDITSGTYSYSGTGASGSVTLPSLSQPYVTFRLTGNGNSTSGNISVNVRVVCGTDGSSTEVSRIVTVNYPLNTCQTNSNFNVNPTPPSGGWMNINVAYYPRLNISDPVIDKCKTISFSSPPLCAVAVGNSVWSVSTQSDGVYTDIGSSSGPYSVDVSTIQNMYTQKTGAFYVKVRDSDLAGRESAFQTFFLDAPPPTVTFQTSQAVSCNGGKDGEMNLTISPAIPEIANFVVYGFHESNISVQDNPTNPGNWDPDVIVNNATTSPLNITSAHTASGIEIPAGGWHFKIINNTRTPTDYGTCETVITNATTVTQPTAVTVNIVSKAVTCFGGNNGEMTAVAQGGSGTYSYQWSHSTSVTGNKALDLTPGSYTVNVRDSKNCPIGSAATDTESIGSPTDITVTSSVLSDYNGYQVSCSNKEDGSVSVTAAGGTGTLTYQWNSGETSSSISGKGVGIYTLTVKDAAGCQDITQYDLKAPEQITFTLTETSSIQCAGHATGALAISNLENTIGSVSYRWSSGESSDNISNKPAGSYSLTVTDQQGCRRLRSRELTQPLPYTVSIETVSDHNGKPISCYGGDNGILGATVLNGAGTPAAPEKYDWLKNGTAHRSGPTVNQIDQLTEGLYKVTITYNGICTAEATKFLDDPDPVTPLIEISSLAVNNGTHISCPGENDGSLHASATMGTPRADPDEPYTFIWNNDPQITGHDLTGLAAGTYTVTAKDGNGCPGTATISLENPQPVKAAIAINTNFNGFPVKCHDSSEGIITASATGGTNVYTYAWNFPATPATTAQLSNIPGGTYTVIVNDQNMCPDTLSITLNKPQPVVTSITIPSVADFNGQAISCHDKADGRLEATALGGTNSFTYSWNTVPPTSGNILSGASAGTYIVTTTDLNGCPAKDTVTLDNPTPVVGSITGFSDYNGYGVKCLGSDEGFIEAYGSGGTGTFTFEWPGTPETSFRNADLTAGIYSVIVKDSNGCPDTLSHEITEPSDVTLSLDAFEDITCFDAATGKLTLSGSGGVGGFEYSLDEINWQASPEFPGLRAVTHTVKVRDLNACAETLVKTLSQPEEIKIDVVTEPAFCADPRGVATATVTGGIGNYSYEWKDVSDIVIGALNKIENQRAGTYTLLVTDENDCPMVGNVGITSTDGAKVNSKEIVGAKCSYSADGSGLLEVTEGDGPFTFLWPDGQTSIQGTNLAKGIYLVTVSDVNDCVVVHPVEIPAPEPLEVNLVDSTVPTCNGNCDGKIKVLAEGGTGAYLYTWANQTGEDAQNLCAGPHTVTVTDINSCTLQETFTLLQPEPLQLKLEKRTLPLCFGGCDGQIEVSTTGGNGGYAYSWSNGNKTAAAYDICAGDHIVTVTDSKNCQLEGTYKLGEPTLLQVRQIRKKNPICHDGCNGELEVQAFGGTGTYSYSWNNGVITPALNSLCAADYTVNILDANACRVAQTYSIENPPALVIDLGGSVTLCTGQTHTLYAGEAWTTYNWGSNTNFTATTSKVIIQDAGQYWLDVINSDGCTAQDTFLLETSVDLLKASFLIPKEAFVRDTIAIIDISWPLPETTTWTFPTAMHKVMDLGDIVYGHFNEPGIYEIGLQTFLGQCTDAIGKTILILTGEENTEGGRLGHEEYVKEFTLFPNPTDGDFEVTAEFIEEGPATLSVWNTPTGYLIKKVQTSGKSKYHFHFDLRPLSTGTYILRLDHAKGKKYIRFIVK